MEETVRTPTETSLKNSQPKMKNIPVFLFMTRTKPEQPSETALAAVNPKHEQGTLPVS